MGGGASEVYPNKKGVEKVLALLNGGGGGGTKCFEVVLTQELEALAILKEGANSFQPLKGCVCEKMYPVLSWFCDCFPEGPYRFVL